jgi:hypothetical protein
MVDAAVIDAPRQAGHEFPRSDLVPAFVEAGCIAPRSL